jgi:hypothetical protein
MKYKAGKILDNLDSSIEKSLTAELEDKGNIRLVYGPYRKLPIKGTYVVTFSIRLNNYDEIHESLHENDLVVLDVYDYYGGKITLAQHIIKIKDFTNKHYQKFTLKFEYSNSLKEVLEYRIGVFDIHNQKIILSTDLIKIERIN